MKIREVGADERATVSLPIQTYAFSPSPPDSSAAEKLRGNLRYHEGNLTLVAEEDGVPMADVSAIPMWQNVRGNVYRMAGVANVATLPLARRRGYARALLDQLLAQMRDTGHVVSALYPFRPSFYQRFGYVGLPKTRVVRFPPSSLSELLRPELPGEITWGTAANGYQAYRDFTEKLLTEQHGFSVLPDYRAVRLAGNDDRWLAMAWADGQAIGAVTYQITRFAGSLIADDMLTANPLGRALLLQFLARHVDQVNEVELQVSPAELSPELWTTDFESETQTTISFPGSLAPMGRVLSLTGLAGMPAGPERIAIEVVDDPYIAGAYLLDGSGGALDVTTRAVPTAEATLTAAGLSALVYGVLDPDDILVRGLGDFTGDPAARLRTLFPRRRPYLYARF